MINSHRRCFPRCNRLKPDSSSAILIVGWNYGRWYIITNRCCVYIGKSGELGRYGVVVLNIPGNDRSGVSGCGFCVPVIQSNPHWHYLAAEVSGRGCGRGRWS
jgi:hypothetical protein